MDIQYGDRIIFKIIIGHRTKTYNREVIGFGRKELPLVKLHGQRYTVRLEDILKMMRDSCRKRRIAPPTKKVKAVHMEWPGKFGVAICRPSTKEPIVTDDPGEVTCKTCQRLIMKASSKKEG